jgi:hypothetical protein
MSVSRRYARAVWILLTLSWVVPASFSATIHVDQANVSGVEDGTEAFPYATIEAGIGNAASGDKVVVAPGTYKESLVMRDGINVLGAGWRTTIIDATIHRGSAVTFDRTRLAPLLSGFTITGGSGDQRSDIGGVPVTIGGGILILNSSPIIRDNMIAGNVLDDGYCLGAGVYIDAQASDHPMIENNFIIDNLALSSTVADEGRGGAIYATVKNGGATISGNRIEGNRAFEGGGVMVDNMSNATATIERNTFRNNEAVHGAGLWLSDSDDSTTPVINNLFVENHSDAASATGGGIRVRAVGTGFLHVVNNTFAHNSLLLGSGAAMWLEDSAATTLQSLIANNIFAFNQGLAGGGIDHTAFSGTIRNNDLHGNVGGDLYDAGGSTATLVDNLFVDPHLELTDANPYRLGPASTLIDAAADDVAPVEDHGAFPRPFDGNDDMVVQSDFGAYEYPAREMDGLRFVGTALLDWGVRSLRESYNVYRGSLATLRATGEYTQDPLGAPAAARFCEVLPGEMPLEDTVVPVEGEVVFYLVTLELAGWEGSLGDASDTFPRVNTRRCP